MVVGRSTEHKTKNENVARLKLFQKKIISNNLFPGNDIIVLAELQAVAHKNSLR